MSDFSRVMGSFTEVFKAIAVQTVAEAAKQTILPEVAGVTESQLSKMNNDELTALVELTSLIRVHAARRDSPEIVHTVEHCIGRELVALDKSQHSHVSGDEVGKYYDLFDPDFFDDL